MADVFPAVESGLRLPATTEPVRAEQAPGLPLRAKALIAAAFAMGLVTVGLAIAGAARRPRLDGTELEVLIVFGVVIVASWVWPLILYRNKDSEAVHLDEAVLVILALLLPAPWTLLVFAAATVVAQVLRRRALIKTIFNFGQLSTAVGLALAANHALAARTATITVGESAAVTVAALIFFIVNSGSVAAILAATGTPARESVFDGMVVRLSLVAAAIVVGILLALTISAYRWSLPLAVVGLLMLRRVLAAQFSARHDRERLRGLLEATLQVNRNLQRGDVLEALFGSARDLLRCPEISVAEQGPESGQLGAQFSLDGQPRWLIASGRSRAEPFDSADAALLETLAAVAAGALTNALLYHHVGYQRERLAAITGSLGEGVCALDPSGALTFFNPAAARMLGWTEPLATASAAPDGEVPTPAFLSGAARRAMDTQQIVRDEDATFHDQDGNPVPVAFTVAAIIDRGQSIGAVIAFRDLTDRKAFESERTRAQAERQELEARLHQNQRLESLGQLAGGVAHDFNNLLGVISNYATFVGEKVSDAATQVGGEDWQTAHEDLEQIEKAVQRAAGLTHQLLAFARREVIQPRVLNLNDLVTGIEQLLSRTLGEHVTLLTSLAPDLSSVLADPGQMEQVLVNLAVNARDAMPHGGTLTIDTSEVDVDGPYAGPQMNLPAGRYARLRVSDTGMGIPKDLIERVLEPFFTTKPKGEGSGLGLATVYGIIAQAGGHLQIYSEPRIGTTLTALLPVTNQLPQLRNPPAPRRADSATGETVLMVEDEDALREVTHRLLVRNGYRVLVAAGGGEAIDLTTTHPGQIDLLLTDLIMPKMLGKEVAERVTLLRPETRVLYMSGYAQPILSAQGNLPPGVILLEKPFSESALLAKLREVLDRPEGPSRTPHGRDATWASNAATRRSTSD